MPEILLLPWLSILAFFLKGITGIGTSTIMVPLVSYILDAKRAVILASIVNVAGGLVMCRMDPLRASRRYWIPLAVVMIVGSIAGSIALKFTPLENFQQILGIVVCGSGIWFMIWRGRQQVDVLAQNLPEACCFKDLLIGLAGGVAGGFVGINSPILVLYFGSRFAKGPLRRILVLILLPAAIAQVCTFAVLGLIDLRMLWYAVTLLPGLFVGVWLGNRTFVRISEKWFGLLLGIFLISLSLGLIFH